MMGRPKRSVLAAATESTTPPEELTEHQFVARVGKPEGNNTYTCILPNTKTALVELAQRFRNTIWIKRGGFVVLDLTPSEERKTNNRVEGEIINVVRDEKEWRKMPYWPREFPKTTYPDEEDDSRGLPPTDSESEGEE